MGKLQLRKLASVTVAFIALGWNVPSAEDVAAAEPGRSPSIMIIYGRGKRPYGKIANRLAGGAERLCENALAQSPGDAGSYASAYASYAGVYGRSAGSVVKWICWTIPYSCDEARDEAYAAYFDLRYQQALYDYYACLYAWNAHLESGSSRWYAASAKAYQAVYCAWVDMGS